MGASVGVVLEKACSPVHYGFKGRSVVRLESPAPHHYVVELLQTKNNNSESDSSFLFTRRPLSANKLLRFAAINVWDTPAGNLQASPGDSRFAVVAAAPCAALRYNNYFTWVYIPNHLIMVHSQMTARQRRYSPTYVYSLVRLLAVAEQLPQGNAITPHVRRLGEGVRGE
jgi:hypothetical protein